MRVNLSYKGSTQGKEIMKVLIVPFQGGKIQREDIRPI